MNSWSFAVKSLRRDLRTGELSVLLVAIVIAVTAMTAVGFFTDRVGRAIKLAGRFAVMAGRRRRAGAGTDRPGIHQPMRAANGASTRPSHWDFLSMVLPADDRQTRTTC